jgi:antitoxin HicB
MQTPSYPANLIPELDGRGFYVTFPDLPEALTGGDDLDDTLFQAQDCLAEAITSRIHCGDAIPDPSQSLPGQHQISVPETLTLKLALYLAFHRAALPLPDAARRMGIPEGALRRMLNPKQHTSPTRIHAAMAALEKAHS